MSITTVHANIRAAARQLVQGLAGLPSQKFWEGVVFSTTNGVPYVLESVSPIGSVPRSTGTGGTIAHTIAVRYTVGFPIGSGTTAIEAALSAMQAAFGPGSWLVYGGDSALVQRSERTPLRPDGDWISGTVTATVIAYTSR